MARSSSGSGVTVAVVLMGILTLGLFVTTFVFLGQKQNAEKEKADLEAASKAIVSEGEKNTDAVRALLAEAGKQNQSLVQYLQSQRRDLSQSILGNPNASAADLTNGINAALGEAGGNLVASVRARDARIAQLDKSAKDADAARQAALADLQAQAGITKKQQEDFDAAMAAIKGDVGKYQTEIEAARAALDQARGDMASAIDANKREYENKEADLNARIAKANDELLVAQAKVRELQRRLGGQSLSPADEYALVDGEVIDLDASGRNVFINRGRKDKVVLGLTFEVYGDPAGLRPDPETGEYNRGKATVEVIKIDEDSSTARIIRQARGNPIVKGDIVANPVYDPKKVYVFRIFGDFDFNGDGRLTSGEQVDIAALISQWGGRVTDQLTGDVDFVVLGTRPVVPPRPRDDAPPEVIEQHVLEVRKQQDYDRLLQQAGQTSIPILNQNRLFTLIGR